MNKKPIVFIIFFMAILLDARTPSESPIQRTIVGTQTGVTMNFDILTAYQY
jgi:hypothetical protein